MQLQAAVVTGEIGDPRLPAAAHGRFVDSVAPLWRPGCLTAHEPELHYDRDTEEG